MKYRIKEKVLRDGTSWFYPQFGFLCFWSYYSDRSQYNPNGLYPYECFSTYKYALAYIERRKTERQSRVKKKTIIHSIEE